MSIPPPPPRPEFFHHLPLSQPYLLHTTKQADFRSTALIARFLAQKPLVEPHYSEIRYEHGRVLLRGLQVQLNASYTCMCRFSSPVVSLTIPNSVFILCPEWLSSEQPNHFLPFLIVRIPC